MNNILFSILNETLIDGLLNEASKPSSGWNIDDEKGKCIKEELASLSDIDVLIFAVIMKMSLDDPKLGKEDLEKVLSDASKSIKVVVNISDNCRL